MKLYRFITTAFLFSIIAFMACERPMSSASGSYHNVICLATSELGGQIEPYIKNNVQKYVITPQKEAVYDIYFMDSLTFHKYLDQRLLLICSTINSDEYSSRMVRQMLSDEAREEVEKRGYGIFVLRDLWAEGQMTGFIIASDTTMLLGAIELYGPIIADAFTQEMNNRLYIQMLNSQRRREELDTEKKIEEEYGFHISVPEGYEWENGSAKENFLWLRHLQPEQWIFIYREKISENASSDSSDTTIDDRYNGMNFIHKRDSLCALYYEFDVIDSIVSVEYGFIIDSLSGFQVQGVWRNDSSMLGGPFVSYVFDDSTTMTRYILDAAMFLPGKDKEHFLRMTHSTLYSFKRNIQ